MNTCLKGINSLGAASPFQGAGLGRYSDSGAKSGFATKKQGSRRGFRMESFVFGYPTEDNVEFYEVDRNKDLLGQGADCAYKCRNIATNEKHALKIYELKHGTRHRRSILSDLNAHQSTAHPHIVKYKAVIETEEQIFVLMELILGKDLFGDIIDRQGLSEGRAAFIMKQLTEALMFLHDKDVIHGDLKPENVMLEQPETDTPFVKVIDFGFSCFLNKSDYDFEGKVLDAFSPCLDAYAPHEAFDPSPSATKDSDMFRMGCCLYVMVMGTFPFNRDPISLGGHEKFKDIARRKAGDVMKYAKWHTLSENVRDLITSLCRDRISCKQVLEHPFIIQQSS